MTEVSNESTSGPIKYIYCNEDFIPKDPEAAPLKQSSDRFRFVELVKRHKTKGPEDPNDYVRFQLSPNGRLFSEQIDIFTNTGEHPSIVQFKGFELYPQRLAITKYYPNGSLQHILKEINEGKLSFDY